MSRKFKATFKPGGPSGRFSAETMAEQARLTLGTFPELKAIRRSGDAITFETPDRIPDQLRASIEWSGGVLEEQGPRADRERAKEKARVEKETREKAAMVKKEIEIAKKDDAYLGRKLRPAARRGLL